VQFWGHPVYRHKQQPPPTVRQPYLSLSSTCPGDDHTPCHVRERSHLANTEHDTDFACFYSLMFDNRWCSPNDCYPQTTTTRDTGISSAVSLGQLLDQWHEPCSSQGSERSALTLVRPDIRPCPCRRQTWRREMGGDRGMSRWWRGSSCCVTYICIVR